MNADRELQNTYSEWRRLAEAEGEAIRAGNWMLVFDCQNVLRQLQPRLVRQTDAARREWLALDLDLDQRENDLNATIQLLIALESQNSTLIDDRRRRAQDEMAKLETASLTLRRIQRSYAPQSASAWQMSS